jgi:hypothetical protein
MVSRGALAILGALAGYAAGAIAGALLVMALSSNTHDKSVEAAMTGAFASGPLCAIIGFIVGFTRSRRPSPNR